MIGRRGSADYGVSVVAAGVPGDYVVTGGEGAGARGIAAVSPAAGPASAAGVLRGDRWAHARSTDRCTFPSALLGSSSTKNRSLGCL